MANVDKYVEYVIAQIGEGNHSYKDIVEDLKERGLSDSEISEVLQLANYEGNRIENEQVKFGVVYLLKFCILPLLILILYLIEGINFFGSHSFRILLGVTIAFVYVIFRKKKFPKK